MHIEKRKFGKIVKYYLSHSYREGSKVYKFRNYLGKDLNKQKLNDFILDILSSEIENILSPSKDKELMINFLFQIYQKKKF